MTTRRTLGRPGTVVVAVLALFGFSARPARGVTISFADFSETTGLTLNGSAAAVSTGDGVVLRLVPALAAQAGSFFGTTAVRTADFSTAFSFRLTNPGGISDAQGEAGADGFVFVVQPVASNVGGAGSGLGYAGISPSLGVEFDIFFNGASDTSTNHLGVDLNGNVNSVAALHVSPRWDDGNRWWAWIDYDGATLEVRVAQSAVRPMDPLLSHVVDLATLIGQEEAFVGFTAGTGSAWADHDVIEWTYFDAYNPGGTTTTTATVTTTTTTTSSTSTTSTTTTSSSSSSVSSTAVTTTTSSTTTTVPSGTTVLPAGTTLLVKQKKSGAQRLQLIAKGPDVASALPCETGGELAIEAVGAGGSVVRFALEAGLWKPIKAKKPERGCKYRKGPVVATAQVKAGRMLKVTANAPDLGIPLATDPRPVRIELRHGEVRHCVEFGGDAKHKPDKKLLAKRAGPAAACPAPASPGGAFVE